MNYVIDNDVVRVDNPVGPEGAYLYLRNDLPRSAGDGYAGVFISLDMLRTLADALTDMADQQEERIRISDLQAVLAEEALDYSWEADRQFVRVRDES